MEIGANIGNWPELTHEVSLLSFWEAESVSRVIYIEKKKKPTLINGYKHHKYICDNISAYDAI